MLVLVLLFMLICSFFFFKQKTAYDMRISDWSSDVCSSDLESGDAFLKIARPDPGCILLDLRMPGMDGLEVQDELRARGVALPEIGRASCRERVCQYV